MPADNERFGATAAGSADLKGSAEMPPLRQAAIPLGVSVESVVEKVARVENEVQSDNVMEKADNLKNEHSPDKVENVKPLKIKSKE